MKNPEHIVITGATSGIGAALALHYARPGVQLALAGRDAARMADVARCCRDKGAQVHEKIIDVTDAPAMESWLSSLDAERPVDLLIANAGISGGSGGTSVLGEDPEQLRRILRVNVDGVVNTVSPLIAPMVARRQGQIAIMSSLAGLRALPSAPAYSTSKIAVRGYGEALRGWLSSKNVRVNVIMPGYIQTPMTKNNPFPMPFLMTPEKAARIIAHGLAKNRARIAFPLPMYLPVLWISLLPVWLTDPIFSRLPAKPAITP